MQGLFFTGTDTGIGKTWVTSIAARPLSAQGVAVGAYKPTRFGFGSYVKGVKPSDHALE